MLTAAEYEAQIKKLLKSDSAAAQGDIPRLEILMLEARGRERAAVVAAPFKSILRAFGA